MWTCKKYNKTKNEELVKNGMHRMSARILSQLDIPLNECNQFIQSEYSSLSHPYKLNDVEKASEIFVEAIKNKHDIAVIGDYDADGIVSSTMLKELCNSFKLKCHVFLPSRIEHGYGLSEKTIESFLSEVKDKKPELLIITDCGTNNFDEIKILKDNGIKNIIVIDHHTIDKSKISKNADALISWHLSENYNEMCACGEVFQFIRGVKVKTNKINPIEFLSYAAIGTIADVSPVVGDNRILIKNGLSEYCLNHIHGIGLSELLKQIKMNPNSLTVEDISFKIAPAINAVGRMSHPYPVYKLLIERDPIVASQMSEHILNYNVERKKLQKQMEEKSYEIVEKNNYNDGILIFDENFHIGIAGIVASKVAEKYNKPTLIIGKLGDVWKGSGRTVGDIDLKNILDTCPEIFDAYGGHASAVGVTLNDSMINDAEKIFNDACKKHIEKFDCDQQNRMVYNANLKPSAISIKTGEILIRDVYPYCPTNNPEPIFKLEEATIVNTKIINGEGWTLLKFNALKNDIYVPYQFKIFSNKFGNEINERKANIYFKFPQKTHDDKNKYFSFELSIVDLEIID